MHVIAKCNRAHNRKILRAYKKHAQMHERVPCGTCPLDDGRRPDQPTKRRQPDRFTNDESSEKDMFPAEHIFFEVPHHVPICVHFYSLSQTTARHL